MFTTNFKQPREETSEQKVIHIAGTKGKGSTALFLSNILIDSSSLSSPHIRTIRELMLLGIEGKPVSADTLHSLFHKVKKILDQAVACDNRYFSHFEVLTAIAFTLFADQNVDITDMEAALVGAQDATNTIANSELVVAVITTIGKELLDALEGSLESIALVKSGIIKHGWPAWCFFLFIVIFCEIQLKMINDMLIAVFIVNMSKTSQLNEGKRPHKLSDPALLKFFAQTHHKLQCFIKSHLRKP